jgi:hypothetical protein
MTEAANDDADSADRRQLATEAEHWHGAAVALADLDTIAAPAAWAGLEDYLRLRIRDQLASIVAGLVAEAASVAAAVGREPDTELARQRLLAVRRRYIQVETVLDFYGDAVATRTNPTLGAILRGLDVIAGDSLAQILDRLDIEVPPAVVYVDKGLGAAILRNGVRLWDRSLSPVAAIKLTRHNLCAPTALLHETGHQVAYLTGWTAELADALFDALSPRSRELAEIWRGWASELAGDVHAFVQAGWAPLPALANVVDGATDEVFRLVPLDPHPFPWLRVLFNAALCRSWYGAGPWDELAATWTRRHRPDKAPADVAALARLSVAALDVVVEVCTRRPMACFRGRPLCALADPNRVSPHALDTLARHAGPSLLTSQYLARREPLVVLASLSTQPLFDSTHTKAPARCKALHGWLTELSSVPSARVA